MKKIKHWNGVSSFLNKKKVLEITGRTEYRDVHIFVAAHNVKDFVALVDEFNERESWGLPREISKYFNDCWGTTAEFINSDERGIWVTFGYNDKTPTRLI